MQRRSALALILSTSFAGVALAQDAAKAEFPSPDLVLKRAWDAAGGLEEFGRLGVLLVDVTSEELAQAGKQTSAHSKSYFATPGPFPGRIELESPKVISGDDGSGGWALVSGKVDSRPSTKLMIRRLLTTNLFALMMPFSLNWEGVYVTGVEPTEVKGVPVWRLTVNVSKSFFHTPQIATAWTVDVHRETYAMVQAQSPATDLGQGIKADGMRISWGQPKRVAGLTLPGEQRVVGLSETGAEKAHSRIDRVRYQLLDRGEGTALFGNPIPPELRPTPPPMRPPKMPSPAKPQA